MPLSSTKPRSKRAKVANDKEETASIHERVETGRYSTIQEFLGDIEKASSTVIERSKTQASGDRADETPLTETVNRIAAFKKVLNSLVRQVHVGQPAVKTETPEGEGEAPAKSAPSNGDARSDGTVLTLFGNPSNPKHLFSSLRKSVKVPLISDGPETEKYVEVQPPLRDVALPNGINTTKVAPTNLETESKQPKRTFGEVFAPRPTLPQLEPPRRTRSSSRSTWIDSFDAMTNYKSFPGERNNYCLAPLPSGQWLQYGGVTSSPSYWNRKQKDGDAFPKSYEDPLLATEEHPSLLQGVYSSFAPSFDSSGAVVQADSKDLVWWGKRGAKRLHSLLSIPYEEESRATPSEQPGNIGELDENTLEEMVKTFNPEDFADNVTYAGREENKEQDKEESKEMEALLRDVSELLETLSSYQKVRNLDISASGNQDASPDRGHETTPSAAERSVYETLKSSLSALISTLPPYAVSKLDGDQLAELNISQKILVENQDYHGTMEKDDFTLQQERITAMAPAVGSSSHRTSTPNVASAGRPRAYQGYNRPYVPAQGFPTPQAYYGARQPSTPVSSFNPGQFAGPRPAATPSQRPGYLPQYAQATPTLAQLQRPGQTGYSPYAAQQGPPTPATAAQASPQSYTPRPAPQPQPGVYNAPYAAARSSTSPQKQSQYNTSQPRTPYMTPTAQQPSQQRYAAQPQPQPQQQQQQQQSIPYAASATPQSGNYSNSAAAMTYARSAAEQAALMDRNKAQLAAQRQSSSTPQPTTTASQDQGDTPGSKPNGTPV